jgi:hypothetical protein
MNPMAAYFLLDRSRVPTQLACNQGQIDFFNLALGKLRR